MTETEWSPPLHLTPPQVLKWAWPEASQVLRPNTLRLALKRHNNNNRNQKPKTQNQKQKQKQARAQQNV